MPSQNFLLYNGTVLRIVTKLRSFAYRIFFFLSSKFRDCIFFFLRCYFQCSWGYFQSCFFKRVLLTAGQISDEDNPLNDYLTRREYSWRRRARRRTTISDIIVNLTSRFTTMLLSWFSLSLANIEFVAPVIKPRSVLLMDYRPTSIHLLYTLHILKKYLKSLLNLWS